MKRSLIVVLCIFMSFFGKAEGIEFFEGKWEDAMAVAKEEGKLLFVDCYTTWCGPCRKMSSQTFKDAEVGQLHNSSFVSIKLDMEKENGMRFGLKYPVSAYPTMFYLDGNGEIIHKIKGFRTAEQFIGEGNNAIKKYDRSGEYVDKYEAGDRSYDLMMSYVSALVQAGKPSSKIANDYIRSNPEISEQEMAMFLYTAATEADSKIFEKMVAQKDLIVNSIGQEKWDAKIISACRKTVDNAVEYEYYELIEEASDQIKSQMGKSEAKKFKCESCIAYFKSTGDYDGYFKYMKDYVGKIAKDDLEGLKWSLNDLLTTFRDQKTSTELAEKAAERITKLEDNVKNQMNYARVLTLNGDNEKALKVLQKERSKAIDAGKSTRLIDRVIKNITKTS